ncbi:MAG: anti-sigma factor [Acidobacteriota bacterium]|nr:anti-sigma factor [Acidobacteriota bacterium]
MEHDYWQERLQAYLDNELSPADHTAVKNHIDESPELKAELEYFRSMKKRLLQHRDTVQMPESVAARIQQQFKKKRVIYRWGRYLKPSYALAMAAGVALAVLLPMAFNRQTYAFGEKTLTGTITCSDCSIADRAGLQMGVLCKDGHQLGLIGEDGNIYRIAMDDKGLQINDKQGSLYNASVEIRGELLPAEKLIRVLELKEYVPQQASF